MLQGEGRGGERESTREVDRSLRHTREVVLLRVEVRLRKRSDAGRVHDANDLHATRQHFYPRRAVRSTHHAVDGDDFAEDDAIGSSVLHALAGRRVDKPNEILRANPRRTYTTTENARACDENAPACPRVSCGRARPSIPAYHAAPSTLRPTHRPIPVPAHAYGLDSSRKRPTSNASPESARHVSGRPLDRGKGC
jgi:hypothetical protein